MNLWVALHMFTRLFYFIDLKKCNSVFKFLLYCYHLPPLSEYFLWKCPTVYLKPPYKNDLRYLEHHTSAKTRAFFQKFHQSRPPPPMFAFAICDMKLTLFHLKSKLSHKKPFRFRLSQGKKFKNGCNNNEKSKKEMSSTRNSWMFWGSNYKFLNSLYAFKTM